VKKGSTLLRKDFKRRRKKAAISELWSMDKL